MTNYNKLARNVDGAVAALIQVLKQRGVFYDTLLVFTTEFNHSPYVQIRQPTGEVIMLHLLGMSHKQLTWENKWVKECQDKTGFG